MFPIICFEKGIVCLEMFFVFCDLRVLVRKLACPFGHPTQVSTQAQLAATCDYLRVRLARALYTSFFTAHRHMSLKWPGILKLLPVFKDEIKSSLPFDDRNLKMNIFTRVEFLLKVQHSKTDFPKLRLLSSSANS